MQEKGQPLITAVLFPALFLNLLVIRYIETGKKIRVDGTPFHRRGLGSCPHVVPGVVDFSAATCQGAVIAGVFSGKKRSVACHSGFGPRIQLPGFMIQIKELMRILFNRINIRVLSIKNGI